MGNIAISLATFTLVITLHFFIKKQYKSTLFGFVAIILAIMTSALSGARGGWIGLPVVIGIILFLYKEDINKKLIITLVTVITIGLTALIANPKFGIEKRYNAAKSDIVSYLEKTIETPH
ncbi:pyridoxamine 5'-phosphate oxidase [Haemophilus influenzae 3655]|uniref:Pyridoxamine 5'-phosphate oxidase n=1 Tax=Haemophilus influenzae (strain NTHi 3655) TaxID=375177 RepID=A0A0H3PP85_HAEI3|nr:pyridoxamine 5'-phosphate oxidase [Haemophilus influenzae 3655]